MYPIGESVGMAAGPTKAPPRTANEPTNDGWSAASKNDQLTE